MSLEGNIQGIELIWIAVANMDAAVKYYTEVLGFTLKERNDQFRWAELQGPSGIRLGLGEGEDCGGVSPGGNAVITISVKDISKARQDLQRQRAVLVGDIMEIPGHVKMQTLKDPSGNMLQLCEKL